MVNINTKMRNVLIIVLIAATSTLIVIDRINVNYLKTDFASFFFAGVAKSDGKNFYDYNRIISVKTGYDRHLYPYIYTPLLAQFISPFTRSGSMKVQFIWSVLMVIFFSVSIYLLLINSISGFDKKVKYKYYIFLIFVPLLTIVLTPFRYILYVGQVDPFIFIMLTFAFILLSKEMQISSGIFFAMAAVMKIIPFLFIFYLLFTKKYKAVISLLISGLLIVCLSILFFGYGDWMNFYNYLIGFTNHNFVSGLDEIATASNYSLQGVLHRLFPASFAKYIAYIVEIIFLIFFYFKAKKTRDINILILPFSAFVIICNPILWRQHVLYLIPGVYFFLSSFLKIENKKLYYVSYLVFLFVFIAQFDFITFTQRTFGKIFSFELPFIALICLIIIPMFLEPFTRLIKGGDYPITVST
jgi:alpha-1,2-mannosyltransferase